MEFIFSDGHVTSQEITSCRVILFNFSLISSILRLIYVWNTWTLIYLAHNLSRLEVWAAEWHYNNEKKKQKKKTRHKVASYLVSLLHSVNSQNVRWILHLKSDSQKNSIIKAETSIAGNFSVRFFLITTSFANLH